ncbi:hypothetical protein [Angustibacter peucedani]
MTVRRSRRRARRGKVGRQPLPAQEVTMSSSDQQVPDDVPER